MPIINTLWPMAIGISLTLSGLNFYIWIRQQQNTAHLIFSMASFLAAWMALFELLQSTSQTIDSYTAYLYYSTFILGLLLISIVWFIVVYFGTARRWLAIAITIFWTISLIINLFSPNSLAFSEITELKNIVSPWGETFHIAVGVRNPWSIIADITSLLIIIFFIDSTIRLIRQGNRRRAVVIGGSSIFFMVFIGIHTPLVDMAIVPTPYLISFSFLMIILAMGSELGNDIVRTSVLSKEIKANERRWQSLLEKVELLIVEISKDGMISYINPYFLKSTGYQEKDLLGKPYITLIPEEDREAILELAQSIQTIDELPKNRTRIVGRSGEKKTVNWSNVGIFDSDGSYTGTLAVGEDITDREKACMEIEKLKNNLQEENIYLKKELVPDSRHQHIIGKGDALKYALTRVEQVAPTDTTVLIEGETGVGKELFARAIHQASGRANQVFIEVNCPAIPSNLIESELFGHEKGSFTGAHTMRKGRFEVANNGTLFLDEIGELPPGVQSKLLRILEEGKFERVGSSETHKVDVRVIAATNRNLKVEVNEGRFRDDLYYRLSAYPISVPPLRKRKEDIPLLIESFVDKFSRKLGRKIDKIPREILQKLLDYSWPGNVRELRNVMESSVIGSVHEKLILSPDTRNTLSDDMNKITEEAESLSLEEVERDHILKILKQCSWRINGEKGAAKILDIHPNTLRNRMIKLNIAKP